MSDPALLVLVERYLDGDLDAVGMGRLRRCLEGDAAVAQTVRELVATSLLLRAWHRDPRRSADLVRGLLDAARPESRRDLRAAVRKRLVRRRTGRRSLLVAAGLVGAITAGLLAWVLTASGPGAVLRDGRGTITVLAAGTTLTTGRTERSTITFEDSTTLTLAGDTRMRIERLAPPRRLHLLDGAVNASVAPQPRQAPFTIATPQGAAEVLGTRFRLELCDDTTCLQVEEGHVRLHGSAGQTVEVVAGQQAVVGTGEAPAINRAYGHPATASSVYQGLLATYGPQRGNDGLVSTLWANQWDTIIPVKPSQKGGKGLGPWWQVDLGDPCRITRVELVARQDARFLPVDAGTHEIARQNFEVRASRYADGRDAVIIARKGPGPFPVQGTWRASVTDPGSWRYLWVMSTGSVHFNFAEFRACGFPVMAGTVRP